MVMFSHLARQYGRLDAYAIQAQIEQPAFLGLPHGEFYDLIWSYYLSNNLYDMIKIELQRQQKWSEEMKELRNPAHRSVEFHVAKLYPGDLPDALPIKAKNDKLHEPISRVWRWSNFSAKKQLLARWFACLGDGFVKVTTETSSDGETKIIQQAIDPRYVTEFQVDMQGHVQFIRIDVPRVIKTWKRSLAHRSGEWVFDHKFWTEVWDRETVKIWAQSDGPARATEQLGNPDPAQDPQNVNKAHNLPFVPFVWAPFKDIGASRGLGVFAHCLGKIDECNRVATRLHDLIFRHDDVTWALESNHVDPTGRPLAPPRIGNNQSEEGEILELGESKVVRLPGNTKLVPVIPSLDYNALTSVLREMQEELRNDLPELRYYDITTRSHVSGTAMRLALADAIDRVQEARGMMFGALVRANAMALTIGQLWKLKGFESGKIGKYEQGDFEHSISRPAVIDLTPQEESQAWGMYSQAGIPPKTIMRRLGWSQEDQEMFDQDRKAEIAFQNEIKKEAQDLELEQAKKAEKVKAEVAEEQQDRALARQEQEREKAIQRQKAMDDEQAEKQIDRKTREHKALKEVDLEIKKREANEVPAPPAPASKNGVG
jgi:hypothetical protein